MDTKNLKQKNTKMGHLEKYPIAVGDLETPLCGRKGREWGGGRAVPRLRRGRAGCEAARVGYGGRNEEVCKAQYGGMGRACVGVASGHLYAVSAANNRRKTAELFWHLT